MSAVGAMAHAERSAAAAAAAVISSANGVDSAASGSAVADSAASAAAAGSNVVAAAAVGHADQLARLRKWVLPRGDNWFYPVGRPAEDEISPTRRRGAPVSIPPNAPRLLLASHPCLTCLLACVRPGHRRGRSQRRRPPPAATSARSDSKHQPPPDASLGPKRVSTRRILSPITSVAKHSTDGEGTGGADAGASGNGEGIWNKAPVVTVAAEPFCLPLHLRVPWVMSRLCFALGVTIPSRHPSSPLVRAAGRRPKSESFDSTDSLPSEADGDTGSAPGAGSGGGGDGGGTGDVPAGSVEREAGVAYSSHLTPVREVDVVPGLVTKQRMRRDLGACCKVLVKRTAQHRCACAREMPACRAALPGG